MARFIFAFAICSAVAFAAEKADYRQTFDDPAALKQFVFTDPAAWTLGKEGDNAFLELKGGSKYKPPHRSPLSIALLADRSYGSFTLAADLLQTGKEYGHRDLCLFFNVQDPAHYYYVHIATKTDPHAHNIFIVNGADRKKISATTTDGFDWGKNKWQKVKLVRDIESGSIEVFVNDEKIMTATDKTFTSGYLGFGSFDDSGRIDNLTIIGESAEKKSEFFQRKPE